MKEMFYNITYTTDSTLPKTEKFEWTNPASYCDCKCEWEIYEYEDWLGIAQQVMAIELGYTD